MLYSRLLAPWLLWLALMLTETEPTAVRETTPRQDNSTECLGLCDSTAQRICGSRMTGWEEVRSAHCGRRIVDSIPSLPADLTTCLAALRHLIHLDAEAYHLSRNFLAILSRFDCPQHYSVKFNCQQCQKAYLDWICSAKISFWDKKRNIKPCRSFCHRVEQRCPFFLPLDKGPAHYAGEPTFLCLDPNIEETGEQMAKSSYGSNNCCYDECENGICSKNSCDDDSSPKQDTSSAASHPTNLTTLILMLTCLIMYRTRLLI
ncbi:transmembrane protein FAM155A [Cimex lectularius]|uniref:Uncharacterized protein n=1 Tax=Cimex lectularius TaxID=79782 RepID=A0A8I6S2V1_CIMLE|nr:transmembrane protein FAM155A [Cimex lectularius]XP_014254803.1 transmembrane protein FAM155A [Cimex lectularius]